MCADVARLAMRLLAARCLLHKAHALHAPLVPGKTNPTSSRAAVNPINNLQMAGKKYLKHAAGHFSRASGSRV